MATLRNPVQWLIDFLTGETEDGDRKLSGENALTYAPFWNSVNKITGNIGVMPLCLYRKTADGKELAEDDDRYRLLMSSPNKYQTPIIFKALITAHSVMWGNGRAYIARAGRRVRELIPLLPDRTKTLMVRGEKYHITWPHDADRLLEFEETGTIGNMRDVVMMADSEVCHIPGFGIDGIEGLSLLKVAARSINTGIAGDKRYNTQVSKGFAAKGILEVPRNLLTDPKEAQEFLDQFNERNSGKHSDKAAMLRDGMTYKAVAMSNSDAEFIKNRQFQRQDTALWFMIESILGDGQTEVYKSLAERKNAYLTNCLLTWMTKWEEELNAKLRTPTEIRSGSHFFKFDSSVFLTTDFASMVDAYRKAVEAMILTPNEARDALDYNTVEDGNAFRNPNTTSGNSSAIPNSSSESQNLERSAVNTQISHLIGVEKNRVLQFADKPEKFLHQLDKFYAKFADTLQSAIDKYAAKPDLGKKWCSDSKDALLQVTDVATDETLRACVEEELSRWSQRVETLVTEICNA